MAVAARDLKMYMSVFAPLQTGDGIDPVGGGIDTTGIVTFIEFEASSDVQVVSSAASDAGSGNRLSVSTREQPGLFAPVVLNGQTPEVYGYTSTTFQYGALDFQADGDVALESVSGAFTGTLSAGSDADVTLPGGASAVDDFYRGWVVRETNGSKRIRMIVSYNGTTKVAIVDRAWGGTAPGATTTVRVSKGFVLVTADAQVWVMRPVPFAENGVTYYAKFFIKNTHATDTFSAAQVLEVAGGSGGHSTFALATTVNDTGTNGAGNDRRVAPSSGVTAFNSSAKTLPGDTNLDPGERIGVWIEYAPVAAEDNSYTLEISGASATRDFDLPTQSQGAASFSYEGSGGIVFGGAADTSVATTYSPTGGLIFGGAAVVEVDLQQVIFQILQAYDTPLAVFFDVLGGPEELPSADVTFDIYEGCNGAFVMFNIVSGKLRTARLSEDVQRPVAEVIIN